MQTIDEQIKIIMKGAEVISVDDLRKKLEKSLDTGIPLTVKLGLDPTAPDIHLGHTVVLRKIRQFQDLGHRAVIIIGDFTGMIGDPTGKSKARRQLTREEVITNARTYESQVFKILNRDRTQLKFNSEWLSRLSFEEVIRLASKCTVARMLERDDFQIRFQEHESIGVHEFFYPLMQSYDSVELKADVELGGTDQRFNILMGRSLQKDYGQESQVAIFMPILEGIDGVEKMSKSLGNYIGIDEEPKDIYGKVMSIPDPMIIKYFELVTDIHPDELMQIKTDMGAGSLNPRDVKMRLAKEITALYHGDEFAKLAEEHFRLVFQRRELPEDVSEFKLAADEFDTGRVDLAAVLVSTGLAASKSEARRLISQGGVRINGRKTTVSQLAGLHDGDIIQAGKLKMVKIRLGG